MSGSVDSLTLTTIINRLKQPPAEEKKKFETHQLENFNLDLNHPPRLAAVLIPLLRFAGTWNLLYIRRTENLVEHSGQVAFPGGTLEPQDANTERAALREAQEEIGLLPTDVQILGRLPETLTITNYLVTPYIGIIPWPYKLTLEIAEVSRVFTIPLSWLANPSHYHFVERRAPHIKNKITTVYYDAYEGEVLWGLALK